MPTYTSNYRIPHLDQNTGQPEIPENTAKDIIDGVLSGVYTYNITATDVSNGYVTISHTDSLYSKTDWHSFIFNITDTGTLLTTDIDIVFPNNSRPYIFKNNTLFTLTYKTTGGTGTVLGQGRNAYMFSDGTNMELLEFLVVGAGTTYETLTDITTFSGNALKLPMVNASEDTMIYYDIIAALALKLDHTGGTVTDYGETAQSVTSSSNAMTIDLTNGNVVNYTAIEASAITLSTTHTNTSFTMLAVNFGAFVQTWTTTVKWESGVEPTWSTSGSDLITFTKIGSAWIAGALIGIA